MRKRRCRVSRSPEEMSLQITSMADIFTIILVFLLKTYSTSLTSISPSSAVTLPEARSSDNLVEALKLEISPHVILLDGTPVTALNNFRFDRGDLEANGTSRSLNTALLKVPKPNAEAPQDPNVPHQLLLVLADEKTPYSIIHSVMDSAQASGFDAFKLAVVEGD